VDNFRKPGGKKFSPKKGKTSAPQAADDGTVRLNKYIAQAGIASRREADKLILAGLVEVNDKTVTEMGYKVGPNDLVKFNGTLIRGERLVYIVLNKPKGFITTTNDPKARKTVMELVANAGTERIYPVGRLDRKTTGLLLFTNDGELAEKLSHPSHGARKIYEVSLDKPLSKTDFIKIKEGITLSDGPIKVDEIAYMEGKSKNNLGIVIHSGKNRIIRRIFEHLDYEVTKLDRTYFAGITKKNIPRGKWRKLDNKEVNFLKSR
jgi:23S rRNA pseudouridine2605 synthase